MIRLVPYDVYQKDTLVGFVVSFWKAHHGDVSREAAEAQLADWTKDEHRLYAVFYGDTVVGFLRLHKSSPDVCWLDEVYIDEPYRGRGMGSGAIRAMEAMVSEEGCKSFCMEVVPDNVAALRLYHRLGYDRLSLVTLRKDAEPFETERRETVAGLSLRVKRFDP